MAGMKHLADTPHRMGCGERVKPRLEVLIRESRDERDLTVVEPGDLDGLAPSAEMVNGGAFQRHSGAGDAAEQAMGRSVRRRCVAIELLPRDDARLGQPA